GEAVPAGQLPAVAGPVDRQALDRLLLGADGRGPAVVLEDLLQVGGPLAAAAVDAVEALGVAAGGVVQLQLVVDAHPQLVGHLAHRHTLGDRPARLQALVGQLEAVVPEGDLAGAQLLHLLPGADAEVRARPALDLVVDEGARL